VKESEKSCVSSVEPHVYCMEPVEVWRLALPRHCHPWRGQTEGGTTFLS